MVPIRRVLCPIDFSKFSRVALDHAIAIARWYGAEITALHACSVVLPVPAFAPMAPSPPFDIGPSRKELEADLKTFVKPARDAGVPIVDLVAVEDPMLAILDAAQRLPADLIVMGTHGFSGFERLALGSVTEKVLRKAPCPVLTVTNRFPAAQAGLPVTFTRILCPIDFSASSNRAVTLALSLAEEAGGCITLLHVVEGFDEEPAPYLPFDTPEHRDHLTWVAKGRLEKLVPDEARTWCEPRTLVTVGKAWRQILDVQRQDQSDLIVMGVLGRNALDLMLFGSTTHHVVREAKCPVLTVRG